MNPRIFPIAFTALALFMAQPVLAAKPAPAKPKPTATPKPVATPRPAVTPKPEPVTERPAPQPAKPFEWPAITANLAAQQVSGRGLVGAFDFVGDIGLCEVQTGLMAPVSAPLSFFTAGAALTFVGHTNHFLPIDLMPIMGFGMAAGFMDVPSGTSTKTDINMWMYMPVGLRYGFNLGGLDLRAEASYHLPAVFMSKGATFDPSRWHVGVDAHTGALVLGAFYEQGPIYNGPGARVGLAFF